MSIDDLLEWIKSYVKSNPDLTCSASPGPGYYEAEALYHLRPDLELSLHSLPIEGSPYWLEDGAGMTYNKPEVLQYAGSSTRKDFLSKDPSDEVKHLRAAFRKTHPGVYEGWVKALYLDVLDQEIAEHQKLIDEDLDSLHEIDAELQRVTRSVPVLH